ncbi:MAG: protein kinase [Moorea sp. SIO3G5]|nr:protein kinase [Moorena sp. SIO3G5]
MICCLNPDCQNPINPDDNQFCQSCGNKLVLLKNRYRPIRPIGDGGFSKTYLAEDRDKLDEHCVIKQLAPQLEGTKALKKARELFEQEAKQLQRLGQHPQIPTLLAYFEEDQRLYLLQEYIEGKTLEQELAEAGPFSEDKIRDLLFELLTILKFVHQQKVIHRDIKPGNIIRRPASAQGSEKKNQLVLIDFGIAKQLKATVMANITGTTIGSFGYVPMEQMEGGKAYAASDLYSLGTTCFHLLTNVHPWDLWKKQGYRWVNSWRKHLKQPVSEQLWWIMDRLLPESYQHRYQSVDQVLEVLELQSAPSANPSQSTSNYHESFLNFLTSLRQNDQLKKQVMMGGVYLLSLGLITQGYGYFRYHTFPSNLSFLIAGLPSSTYLKTTLNGHSNSVRSIAVSPDSNYLVSGSNDHTVKIWNLPKGELVRTLNGHDGNVYSVAITPDGENIASGGDDNTIKIWNLKRGQLKKNLTGHQGFISSVAISSDGKTLVSGSYDQTIKVWNLHTGKLKQTLTGETNWVSSVVISPDGKTLVSGNGGNTIRIWDLDTGNLKKTLTGHKDSVVSLIISPDGKTLFSSSLDRNIKIWDLTIGELRNTLTGHIYYVHSMAISPDGKTLVSGSANNTIKVWDLETWELKTTLSGHTKWVSSLAISPDGKTLISGSRDDSIKVWKLP